MAVTQLSIFLNNEVGRLAQATRVLGDGGINLIGFSVAETVDFGIVRFIVDDVPKALGLLRDAKFTVREGPVVVARVLDEPGGLANVLSVFTQAHINVEYSYAITKGILAFGVADISLAECTLTKSGVSVVDGVEEV